MASLDSSKSTEESLKTVYIAKGNLKDHGCEEVVKNLRLFLYKTLNHANQAQVESVNDEGTAQMGVGLKALSVVGVADATDHTADRTSR